MITFYIVKLLVIQIEMSDMDAKGWCTGYPSNCRKQSVPLHHIKQFSFSQF